MKIFFYPSSSKNNKYIFNMKNSLKKENVDFVKEKFDNGFDNLIIYGLFSALFKKIRVFHLNWIIDNFCKKNFESYKRYFLFKIWVYIMKSLNCKLIWTVHNIKPHKATNDKLVDKVKKFILKKFDYIIVHSRYSKNILKKNYKEEKIIYIPHGHYINNYKITSKNFRKYFSIKKNDFVFLFIGQIRKYKNLELLIKSFSQTDLKKAKLLIAGKPISNDYENKITNLISDSNNIIFYSKFIKHENIPLFFSTADVTVIPYNKKSTLNSGVVYLSLSLKTPIIIPKIGTAYEFVDNNFVLYYDYESDEQHVDELSKKLKNIYNMYVYNRSSLGKIGEQAYLNMRENYNWNDISKELKKLYRGSS